MGRVPRLLIGAARSGSGKTLITCALLKALQKRKKQAVSFKCGPDYIDPLFHREALGIDSDNLDSFLCTPDQVRTLNRYTYRNCEIAVLEGVMGYYDGLGGMKEEASTYDIARITGTPAVLVVDARGASLSLLPLIRGFREFREESQIRGVIFNRMSPGMYPQMKKLVEEETDLRVFGYLPVLPEGILESRHLGLKLPWEAPGWKERLEALGERWKRRWMWRGSWNWQRRRRTWENLPQAGKKELRCGSPWPGMRRSASATGTTWISWRKEAGSWYFSPPFTILIFRKG